MRTVKEVSKLTGISVRTLHYYDEIGLLKPIKVTESGYRLYDDSNLNRLQNILMFRELLFPLKEIKEILDNPEFDQKEALTQQIKLLELKKRHIGELISFARELQEKGVNKMDFNVFNKNEFEQYSSEVKNKWGATEEYKEYRQKTRQKTDKEFIETAERMMTLFAEIGTLKKLSPSKKEVQNKIGALQKLITDNYYTCTNEVLKGLSRLYVEDERMKQNIEYAGGKGTAEFIKNAVSIYCK